jgi:hypothetical protein
VAAIGDLAFVEGAWQRQVVEEGVDAPLPDEGHGGDDKLDIYLAAIEYLSLFIRGGSNRF